MKNNYYSSIHFRQFTLTRMKRLPLLLKAQFRDWHALRVADPDKYDFAFFAPQRQ